jgi:hypothetical protein
VYDPGVVEVKVHDAVVVLPESVTVVGHDPVSPGGTVRVRLNDPDRPNRLVSVTALVPEEPLLNETGVAEMVKSWTVTVRTTEWLSEPLVPDIVTVLTPAGP